MKTKNFQSLNFRVMICVLTLVTDVLTMPLNPYERSQIGWLFPPGKYGERPEKEYAKIIPTHVQNEHVKKGDWCCSLDGDCGSTPEHCCDTCPNYSTGKNIDNKSQVGAYVLHQVETDEDLIAFAARPNVFMILFVVVCSVLIITNIASVVWFKRSKRRSNANQTVRIQTETNPNMQQETSSETTNVPYEEDQTGQNADVERAMDFIRTEITSEEFNSAKMKLLGRGAQADVYKRILRGETVAVKKYRLDENGDNEVYYKLELETLRKMNHRSLLRYMCCIHNNTFVLDWVLFSEWVNHLVEALHYLHQNDIIHRDIKPSNVLVSRDNVLRVCDFGVSRIAAITQCTFVTSTGTPGYDAPEMRRRENYTRKVDVFSFGVLLWEMATRRNPHSELEFSAEEKNAIINKKLPPTLLLMISKCTKINPADRPSFAELRKGIWWGVAQSDIRKNEKDWPEGKKDAQLSANGWNYTMEYVLSVGDDQNEIKIITNK